MILYLHGFRSSPLSTKARQIGARMAQLGRLDEYLCPQLPVDPQQAARLIEDIAREVPVEALTVIGSSLGGFYATWLAERLGCRAVLLNPAVRPDRDLSRHLGVQPVYHSDETIEMRAEFIAGFAALRVNRITLPDRYLLIAAKGDEVLDWREMVAHYPGAHHRVLEGGDHGLSDFESFLDEVLAFAGIDGASAIQVRNSTGF